MPVPPVMNFQYDALSQKLSWDAIPDAIEYSVRLKPSLSPNWNDIYTGPNNYCKIVLVPGTYDVIGKGSTTGGGWGLWTDPPEHITV